MSIDGPAGTSRAPTRSKIKSGRCWPPSEWKDEVNMAIDTNILFSRPKALSENITHYCPGCTHGVIHRLVAEVLDELGVRERTVGVAPVGCSVLAYEFFACDMQEASHGRAMALATGIKRGRPDL